MSQLMLQAPGSTNSGGGTWYDIRFSGRSVEQNAYRYDGIDGGAIISSVPGNLNGELMTPFKLQASLENVQEFRVESSAYPAELGTGSAGQINVITKSGGNAAHGALFEYVRHDRFDAPNYFDTFARLPKSKLRQNQFGGSLGGPIAKDKAFFFGSYEGYRQTAGININAAAFASPLPGTVGNLQRGSLHGPGFAQLDVVIAKKFDLGGPAKFELRTEIFNLFDRANFNNPVASLPNALPSSSLTEANKLQPGQPYTAAAAGAFGSLVSTVSRTVGLGTGRQVQFAFRMTF
jgi:hypothetical protein